MTFTLRVIVQYVFTVELVIECHHLATCSYLDDMILLPSSVPWGSFRVSELNGGGGEREERESGKDKAAKEQGKLSLSEIDFPSSKGKSRTGDGREAGRESGRQGSVLQAWRPNYPFPSLPPASIQIPLDLLPPSLPRPRRASGLGRGRPDPAVRRAHKQANHQLTEN